MNENTSGPKTLEEVLGAKTVSDKTDGEHTAISERIVVDGRNPQKASIAQWLFESLNGTLEPLGLHIAGWDLLWDADRHAVTVRDGLVKARLIPEVKVSVSKQIDDLLSQGNLVVE